HKAVRLAAQARQRALVDAGFAHLRIGHDARSLAQRVERSLHRALGEAEIVSVVKILACVNAPLDNKLLVRIELPLPELLGDNLKTSALDIHGLYVFQFYFHMAFTSHVWFPRTVT